MGGGCCCMPSHWESREGYVSEFLDAILSWQDVLCLGDLITVSVSQIEDEVEDIVICLVQNKIDLIDEANMTVWVTFKLVLTWLCELHSN